MFDLDNQHHRQDSPSKDMQIYLIQNGSPDRLLKYQFKRPLMKEQVSRVCERNWDTKYKSIRFFAIDGVQYEDEDISFIKNKQRVYISRGEEFDYESNFGQYKILKPLGQGGFGKVVLAQNIITKQLAAVKIIKVQKICGASDIDMIFRQIQNLKALNHPNIVKIINCYMLKNMQVYVVMEYLEGGELLKLIKQRKNIPEEQAKLYFQQIISAVFYCHRENIIHRDLKVENILFKSRQEKFIKIADFGISGVADQFNPDFDAGTLKYMAPEVLSAKQKSNTPAVDVWACGIILYYMIFGVLPFTGSSSSHIISAICSGKYVFPKLPFISQECKDLIKAILQISPKKRLKMQEIRDHPWLQNKQSRLRKQFSLCIQSDHIIEDQEIKQEKQKSKAIKLKQIVSNCQRAIDQQIQMNKKKQQRKSLHFARNQQKNLRGPVSKFHKRFEKDPIMQDLDLYGQKNSHPIQHRPMNYKGNTIDIGVKLGGGLHNSSYCSQQIPSLKDPISIASLKDPIPIKLSRANPRLINSSSHKREEKSREPKDSGLKKKPSMINGWK